MRKADLSKNHEHFDAALGRHRAFMEKVLVAQRVISSAQEKRDVAESALLRVCANWEYFVDEHLVDCVNCDHSKLSEWLGVPIEPNPKKTLCQALLFGESYRDFHSLGDLKGFSRRVLPDPSNPFLHVSAAHSKRIDEAFKIRNYLSHYSSRARRSLHALYKSQYGMTRFIEPGQFLLAYRGRRLYAYFDAFKGASADMKAWLATP